MSFKIAFAGKGGTGKTTLAALTVRRLASQQGVSTLAVDADPNTNLGEALGVDLSGSVGQITEDMLGQVEAIMQSGMSKHDWMEYQIAQVVAEGERFDVLSMGRPEGSGCYCAPNSVIRRCMELMTDGYDFVVMDNEAGMEHLSRRTTRDVDALVVVSDASIRGVRIGKRLGELADELRIGAKAKLLVINRAPEILPDALKAEIEASGLTFAGTVPADEGIGAFDLEGGSVFDLDDSSPSVSAMDRVFDVMMESGGWPATKTEAVAR